jgi:GntR family transcriptional regulator
MAVDTVLGAAGPARRGDGESKRLAQSEILYRIRALIHGNELSPGEKLGTERELACRLGVTRSDVRTALATLESNHEVSRRIGRGGGIIVSDNRLERNINTVESLPVIARRQGFVLKSTVLSAVIAPASPSDARLLEMNRDRSNVYDITRLRCIDGMPLSLEISHLPAELFPMLLTKDLTKPFYTRFEQDYGVHPASVDETLESILSSPHESELLHVPESTPLMRIRRIARSDSGVPFERATDVYIASRMRFTMHHSGYVRLSATTAPRV